MRTGWIVAFFLTCGSCWVVAGSTTPSAQRPNIVYILVDDLGYGDVDGLFASGKIKTPCLDRLAAQGMSLTEAHGSASICTPSRYSIMTGRYNWRSTLKQGVLNGFSGPLLEKGRPTVGNLLHDHGYATGYFGKWHLGLTWTLLDGANMAPIQALGEEEYTTKHQPLDSGTNVDFHGRIGAGPIDHGFDEFFGISASLDMPPYTFIHNDHVAAQPTIPNGYVQGDDGWKTRPGPKAPGFEAPQALPTLTDHAIDYIDRHAAAAKAGKPFFLFFAVPTPHGPSAPLPEWKGKSGINLYADYVMETDAYIGKVLDALDHDGLTDNTLVVFASDNGCAQFANLPVLRAHGHDPSAGRRGCKFDIFDGGHRIPSIVRWPGKVAAGVRTNHFVCLGDFMRTCADILQVPLPDTAAEDSISFLPLILGQSDAHGGNTLVESSGHDSVTIRRGHERDTLVESSGNGSFAIRRGPWKLILCPDSGGVSFPLPGSPDAAKLPKFQLYDTVHDPAETTNLVNQHPEVVSNLGSILRHYILNGRSTPGTPQSNDPVKDWPQTAWMDEFK